MYSERQSWYWLRAGTRRSRTTEPSGVRKALTRTEVSRTALGMFVAHCAYFFDDHVHHLVLGGFGLWPNVLDPAEDSIELPVSFGPVDDGDRLEQQRATLHFEVQVIAFAQLQSLARFSRQGDLPAPKHPDKRHDDILLCIYNHTNSVNYIIH